MTMRVQAAARNGWLGGLAFALGLVAGAPPATAATVIAASATTPTATSRVRPTGTAIPIDINSASHAQLKTLPGIGDVEADRIISRRPYFSKADLAEKDVIATGVYLSLKDRIIAKQKPASKGKVASP